MDFSNLTNRTKGIIDAKLFQKYIQKTYKSNEYTQETLSFTQELQDIQELQEFDNLCYSFILMRNLGYRFNYTDVDDIFLYDERLGINFDMKELIEITDQCIDKNGLVKIRSLVLKLEKEDIDIIYRKIYSDFALFRNYLFETYAYNFSIEKGIPFLKNLLTNNGNDEKHIIEIIRLIVVVEYWQLIEKNNITSEEFWGYDIIEDAEHLYLEKFNVSEKTTVQVEQPDIEKSIESKSKVITIDKKLYNDPLFILLGAIYALILWFFNYHILNKYFYLNSILLIILSFILIPILSYLEASAMFSVRKSSLPGFIKIIILSIFYYFLLNVCFGLNLKLIAITLTAALSETIFYIRCSYSKNRKIYGLD